MIRLPDATERMQGRNMRSATKSHLCKLISSKGRQTKDFGGAKLERSFSKAALSGWWQRKRHGTCRCSKLLKKVKRFTHSGIIRLAYKMSWNSCLMSLSEDDSTSADMSRFSQFGNVCSLLTLFQQKNSTVIWILHWLIHQALFVYLYIFLFIYFFLNLYLFYCVRGINVSLSRECRANLCKLLRKLEILCWRVLVRL